MHEKTRIEKKLKIVAERISAEYGNAPVVIIVGGSGPAIPRTMTASSFKKGRLRDLLGLLQASIQIESWKHLKARRTNRRGESRLLKPNSES
jgi:hypothetical protein